MQLNESTYETIFLLYIDNELSPKERLEVETFIVDNPNYAIEMEALKATVLSAENVPYAFKENLKQQAVETSLETLKEDLEEDWDSNYATLLKEDMQAIPGLSTSFKNTLKKETVSEGILIKSFGFNQNKFTYAAIAACLMVFIGLQQLTKVRVSDSLVSNSLATNSKAIIVPSASTISTDSDKTIVNHSSKKQGVNNIERVTKKKQAILSLEKSNTNEVVMGKSNQKESIVIVETTSNNSNLNNQALITKLSSTYNNPIAIDAMPLTNNTSEAETTSYELIDTEDPNRTIYIANFEIDGNKFRGLTRRVSALLKRNKSEKEK
jgi:hypothetical protein